MNRHQRRAIEAQQRKYDKQQAAQMSALKAAIASPKYAATVQAIREAVAKARLPLSPEASTVSTSAEASGDGAQGAKTPSEICAIEDLT